MSKIWIVARRLGCQLATTVPVLLFQQGMTFALRVILHLGNSLVLQVMISKETYWTTNDTFRPVLRVPRPEIRLTIHRAA